MSLQRAIGEDDARKAQSLVERACREGTASEQAEARLLAGRVWLMQGNVQAFRQYLTHMRAMPVDSNADQLLTAYEAWAQAIEGQTEEARASLDALLKSSTNDPSTVDVAEILAQVHLLRHDAASVKAAVAFGRKFADYHGFLSPHLARLFQRRLAQAAELGKDPGAALFLKAERARKARKWTTAIVLYEKLGRDHPGSKLRSPSRFWQAECLRADGRLSEAVKHWQAFIAEAPQGPWRAQAHVGLIDVSLEDAPDLARAKRQVLVALAASRQQIAPPATESWNRAIADLHLRDGLIALIENRYDAAAEGFQSAEHAFRACGRAQADGWSDEGVRRLAALAKAKRSLVPHDAESRDDRVAMRLVLGCAYDVAHRSDKSLALLEPLAAGRPAGPTGAQQSFARLVLARQSESQGRGKDAVLGYRQSIQAFPSGSWHDETLHRQAQLLETLAAQRSVESKSGKPSQSDPAEPSSAADRERARRPRRALAAARVRALGEAAPLWLDLVRKYPKSPRLEPALFHAGRMAALSERPDEAAGHWQRQLAEMPDGIYAGVCHVELSKLRLEHFFDLAGADVQLKDGLAWYEAAQRQAGLGEVAAAVPSLPSDWPADPLVRPTRDVGYDLLLQGGLVAYLSGRGDEAIELFRKARPLASTAAASAHPHAPASGLGRLLAAAEANQELVPQEVLEGDDKAKVCLQLAACYYAAEDFPRVLELTERAMERLPRIKPQQRAWARFLHGRACHALWMPLEGLDDSTRAVAEAPGASWAPQCQFFVANSKFSYAKDVPAAIAAWKHLVNRYPQSELVERASYHIGFAYQAAGQYRQARDSYDAFMEKYPTSPFTKAIEQHHLPEIEAVTLSPSP